MTSSSSRRVSDTNMSLVMELTLDGSLSTNAHRLSLAASSLTCTRPASTDFTDLQLMNACLIVLLAVLAVALVLRASCYTCWRPGSSLVKTVFINPCSNRHDDRGAPVSSRYLDIFFISDLKIFLFTFSLLPILERAAVETISHLHLAIVCLAPCLSGSY